MSELKDLPIVPLDFSLSVVTNYLIFPIDIKDIRPISAKNGCQLAALPYAYLEARA
jgi:hypothetical protein